MTLPPQREPLGANIAGALLKAKWPGGTGASPRGNLAHRGLGPAGAIR